MASMGEIKNKCGGCGQEVSFANSFCIAATKFKQKNLEFVQMDCKQMYLCDECYAKRLGGVDTLKPLDTAQANVIQ